MSPPDSESRPAKRLKTDKGRRGKSKYRPQATFSKSEIHNDDIGIFVTCDKGLEKKCLQELADLLGEFFDENPETRPAAEVQDAALPTITETKIDIDIEADISAELESLRPQQPKHNGTTIISPKLSLVTLDIPCVSFVRFPTGTQVDPVHVVRKLCLNAADKHAGGPRSRYIKRLTPVRLIRKTLNDGLETLCSQILPQHFLIDPESEEGNSTLEVRDTVASLNGNGSYPRIPSKFAIRPTIRNNNKLNRDEVIQIVADKIQALGQNKHKVDLKGYDKLVLVDVYRNVVGMSVVGSEFETLKRFNLAELYASRLESGDDEDDDKDDQTGPQKAGT